MSYYVKTLNVVEGFHCWPKAPTKISYLSFQHRHLFFIRGKKYVIKSDREVEIISLQELISAYLADAYGSPCRFGSLSCEQIAEEICVKFDFDEVEVLEDGFSGGGYRR